MAAAAVDVASGSVVVVTVPTTRSVVLRAGVAVDVRDVASVVTSLSEVVDVTDADVSKVDAVVTSFTDVDVSNAVAVVASLVDVGDVAVVTSLTEVDVGDVGATVMTSPLPSHAG